MNKKNIIIQEQLAKKLGSLYTKFKEIKPASYPTAVGIAAAGYMSQLLLAVALFGGIGSTNKDLSSKVSKIVGRKFMVRVIKEPIPNAFTLAVGIPTVYITSGLLKMLTERETIAVLLHETQHVMSLDMFQSIIAKLVTLKLVPKHFYRILTIGIEGLSIHPAFGVYVIYLAMLLLLWIPAVTSRLTVGRWSEWRADNYAIKMGYGKDLASSFKKIQKWIDDYLKKHADEQPQTVVGKIIQKYRDITDEHPDMQDRIENAMKDKALMIAITSKKLENIKKVLTGYLVKEEVSI